MKNLHLTLTPFKNESRLLKQANSLGKSLLFSEIHILALWEEGVEERETIPSGAVIRRVKLNTRNLPSSLPFQVLKYLEFLCFCLFYAFKNKITVVNCHSLGLLPIGYTIKLIRKGKLVYDAHELETERNGLSGIRKKLSKYFEKLLINKVDLTIVVGDKIADHYQMSYSIVRPTVVLNAPVRQRIKKTDLLREKLGIAHSNKIFLYQGMLTEGRGIEKILSAFCSGKIANDRIVIFMGYGSLSDLIKEKSEAHPNVKYLPAVDPEIVLNYTVSADFGFSLIEPVCLSYEYCLPNKLFEYILSGVTVIASDLPEMERVIKNEKCGYLVRYNDMDDLVSTINKAVPIEASISDKYTWQHQENIMIAAYKEWIL